jgi:hypothetical protein
MLWSYALSVIVVSLAGLGDFPGVFRRQHVPQRTIAAKLPLAGGVRREGPQGGASQGLTYSYPSRSVDYDPSPRSHLDSTGFARLLL